MNFSKRIVLIAVFASFTALSDSIPGIPQFESGVWYSWVFMLVPIIGLILNPLEAFSSVLIGVFVGHYIYFRGPYEFLFALGSPIGAAMVSLLSQRKTRLPILYYVLLLTAYFLTPISRDLPLWGMWDVYLALIILLTIVQLKIEKTRILTSIFIGLEADILFRIFLFVPLQTYQIFYGFTLDTMRLIWVSGAFMTPTQVFLSILFTMIIYPHIKKILKDLKGASFI